MLHAGAKAGRAIDQEFGHQRGQGFLFPAVLGHFQQVAGHAALPPLGVDHGALLLNLLSSAGKNPGHVGPFQDLAFAQGLPQFAGQGRAGAAS